MLLNLLFFLCPVTDISSTVAPIGVKFSMIVPDTASPILEAASLGDPQNSKFWPLNLEYL